MPFQQVQLHPSDDAVPSLGSATLPSSKKQKKAMYYIHQTSVKLQTTRLPFTKAKAAVLINVKPVCQNLVRKIMAVLLNKIILMKLVWSRPGQGIGTNYLKLKWRPNQSPRKGEGNVDLGYRSADAGAAWGHAPGVALSKRSSIDYVEINYRATTMFSFLSLWLLSSLPHLPPTLHSPLSPLLLTLKLIKHHFHAATKVSFQHTLIV